jgi:CBS domain containing-hemolysin-like protein
MTLLLAYATLAIGVSFLCSLLEASLLSLPRSHVEALVERGSSVGRTLQHMKANIDRPLSAILTLNTIAHTVGAAGVGAQAALVFGDAAVGLASAVMTLLILLFSEIVPKTLGVVHAKRLAGITALTTQAMIVLCLPLIWIFERINRVIGHQRHQERLSRSEVLATIRLGREGGSLGKREYRVVSNLLALSQIKVADVLTPRTVVFSLPQDMTVAAANDAYGPIRFARIPVYSDESENITGYVPRFEIYRAISAGQTDTTLQQLVKPICVVPELATVADTLETMLGDGHHIALAVDEHGGTEGVVTLEDLLETLLGEEIVDETDAAVDMRAVARRRRDRRGLQVAAMKDRSRVKNPE